MLLVRHYLTSKQVIWMRYACPNTAHFRWNWKKQQQKKHIARFSQRKTMLEMCHKWGLC